MVFQVLICLIVIIACVLICRAARIDQTWGVLIGLLVLLIYFFGVK